MQQIIGIWHHWSGNKAGEGMYELRWKIRTGYYTQEELEQEKKPTPRKTLEQPKVFQPPPKARKQSMEWLKRWYDTKELRQVFDNDFNEMRDFAEMYGYGSSMSSVMTKHIRDMIRHKIVQEQLRLT